MPDLTILSAIFAVAVFLLGQGLLITSELHSGPADGSVRAEPSPAPSVPRPNRGLELLWTVLPGTLLLVLAIKSAQTWA